ncbi:MAG: hypothetical protein KAI29_06350, partial [Cyclobacteriaceae bacterium]|nr:hypothetical protein [Cyclobacteriaceae bacterium]
KIEDAIAYEHYLLARNEIWTCTKESLRHAIQLLNSSLDKIGRNEDLLVALGTAYFQYVNGGIDPKVEHLDRANEILNEVFELNPSISKAYYLKSMIHETKGELSEAFTSIKQALELDPNDSEALLIMACLYAFVGRQEKGRPFAKHAIDSDPLNPIIYYGEWWVNISAGNLDRALKTANTMFDLDQENTALKLNFALTLALNSKIEEASKLFNDLFEGKPTQFLSKFGKIFRYAINNQGQEALQLINDEIIDAANMDHLWAWYLSGIYSLIGEKEKAIDYVERATRDVFINYPLFSKYDPFLENIRGEERFKKLMEEVKYKWENFKTSIF